MEQQIKNDAKLIIKTIIDHIKANKILHSQFTVLMCTIEVYLPEQPTYNPFSYGFVGFSKYGLRFVVHQDKTQYFELNITEYSIDELSAVIESELVHRLVKVTNKQIISINKERLLNKEYFRLVNSRAIYDSQYVYRKDSTLEKILNGLEEIPDITLNDILDGDVKIPEIWTYV